MNKRLMTMKYGCAVHGAVGIALLFSGTNVVAIVDDFKDL